MNKFGNDFEWLMKHGVHLINFNPEQLQELIDEEKLAELPKIEFNEEVVRMLSQYLVGNTSGTAEELMAMDASDRRRALWTWVDLIKDPDECRYIAKYVVGLN
ncbi:hypothetical protein [Sapientia aquatica]|uniref:Uncharacterized protein n=1 Tax=Sapientia aquatica TaxID=1549640 RepID=A0A4R5W439_9BURK|nr:hypothetical protein [Sapientia aquatica]TDK67470.1 hypothetical protein E2I14_06885 [Sapientia aquatica]